MLPGNFRIAFRGVIRRCLEHNLRQWILPREWHRGRPRVNGDVAIVLEKKNTKYRVSLSRTVDTYARVKIIYAEYIPFLDISVSFPNEL